MTKVRKQRWENQATCSLPPRPRAPSQQEERLVWQRTGSLSDPRTEEGLWSCVWAPLLSWVPGLGAGTLVMLCLWGLAGPAAWSHASQCETEEMYSWSRVFWRVYLQTCTPHCWESPLEKPTPSWPAPLGRSWNNHRKLSLLPNQLWHFQMFFWRVYPGAGGGNLTLANSLLEMKLNSHLLPLGSGCVRNISIHFPRKSFSPGSSGAWLDPVLVALWPHPEGPENSPELLSLLQGSACLSTSQPLTLPPSAWYSFSSAPSSLASPKSVIFTCCGVFTSTFLAARSLCTKRRSSR